MGLRKQLVDIQYGRTNDRTTGSARCCEASSPLPLRERVPSEAKAGEGVLVEEPKPLIRLDRPAVALATFSRKGRREKHQLPLALG